MSHDSGIEQGVNVVSCPSMHPLCVASQKLVVRYLPLGSQPVDPTMARLHGAYRSNELRVHSIRRVLVSQVYMEEATIRPPTNH